MGTIRSGCAVTLSEVREAFLPSGSCGKILGSQDASRMLDLLEQCEPLLASVPLRYGLGHCRLYITADPPPGNLLRVEVYFEGQFVEVSWLENWDDEGGLWTRRDSLRCPAERAVDTLGKFLCRLGCRSRSGPDAEHGTPVAWPRD